MVRLPECKLGAPEPIRMGVRELLCTMLMFYLGYGMRWSSFCHCQG